MNKPSRNFALALALASLAPTLAQAHPGLRAAGFVDGLIHPFTGLDHLLAMIAVGFWAAMLGGAARWIAPAAFVGLMVLGATLGLHAVALPRVEYGVALSVVVLGLLVAFEVKMPVSAAAALVGGFALFHGYAHGSETPVAADAMTFAAGFILATIILHVVGLGLGLRLGDIPLRRGFARIAGGAMALSGCAFVLAA